MQETSASDRLYSEQPADFTWEEAIYCSNLPGSSYQENFLDNTSRFPGEIAYNSPSFNYSTDTTSLTGGGNSSLSGQLLFPISSASHAFGITAESKEVPAKNLSDAEYLKDISQEQFPEPAQQPVPATDTSTFLSPGSDATSILRNLKQIAQESPSTSLPVNTHNGEADQPKTISINFNNVGIIEYIRFISRIANKNFVFDENDLQFTVTIISEEPTTIENIMMALLQELRIHDLTMLEQGNNIIIHKNPRVNAISRVIADGITDTGSQTEIVTQVFRLNTAHADQIARIIKPLISDRAIIDVLKETNYLILTDLISNVAEISKLIKSLDSPRGGDVIGQYVVRTSSLETLIPVAEQIMTPFATDQNLQFIPYPSANSIYVISSPYLVEKAISILQHLDENRKSTGLFNADQQYAQGTHKADQPVNLPPAGIFINDKSYESLYPSTGESAEEQEREEEERREEAAKKAKWARDQNGNWKFQLPSNEEGTDPSTPPKGKWTLDQQRNWNFIPGAESTDQSLHPNGTWILDPAGNWNFLLDKGESISIDKISRSSPSREDIMIAPKKKGMFYLHKVLYRRGQELEKSLQSIGESMQGTENINVDLVNALLSAQWIESSNSIVFSGTPEALEKVRELVEQIDVSLKQVYIEMLVLDTSVQDSLNYGVDWQSRYGGGHWAGGTGFANATPLNGALNNSGVAGLGQPIQIDAITGLPIPANIINPDPSRLFGQQGFTLGVIGERIFNKALGVEFSTMGAFVQALQQRSKDRIVLNPKIITEDGVPAEIFVGENTAFKTQSVVNQGGGFVTNNFEFRDVGTRMKVTPYLGNNNIISLEIEQEISAIASTNLTGDVTSQVAGPTTTKSTTTTRVHIPDGFFVVISGMIRDEYVKQDTQVPCLGGVPLLGAAFKNKNWTDSKRNYMIFVRPQIIQTGEEMQKLTKHQQDVYKAKNRLKNELLLSTEDALEFLNLKRSDNVDVDQAFDVVDGELGYIDLKLMPEYKVQVLPYTEIMTKTSDLRVNPCHDCYYYFV